MVNAMDPLLRRNSASDIVISMLPARMHIEVVKDCIRLKKDIITPSYITDEMKALHNDAEDAGILIMNEIGLDPGIDHMSAKRSWMKLKNGGEIKGFESFTGGLVAPESDNILGIINLLGIQKCCSCWSGRCC